MAKTAPLYALQRDLDMVTQDIQLLKKSYDLLDYIAKVVHDSELEQLAQAAQMRRIEAGMKEMTERIKQLEERIDRMEKTLLLICKHLGIQPA